MTPDSINGLFELVGAGLVWLNVRRLINDGEVKGVCISIQGFFAAWSAWNLYYYPHLDQWWSAAGAAAMSMGNLTWFVIATGLKRKNKCTN